MSTIPDCRTCGRCCFSTASAYVRVTGADWDRLGEMAEQVAHFIGHRAYLRMEAGHCIALRTEPGADGTARYTCALYERRPQVCRDLARGSPACEAEILRKPAGP